MVSRWLKKLGYTKLASGTADKKVRFEERNVSNAFEATLMDQCVSCSAVSILFLVGCRAQRNAQQLILEACSQWLNSSIEQR